MVPQVPVMVRRTADSRGETGRAWLASLPGYVSHLSEAWSLRLGEVLDGGTAAFVVRVTQQDGTCAVLKLQLPGLDFATQVRTLLAAGGCGYVRVYRHDLSRDAALLEPLGTRLARPAEEALDILAATLKLAWRLPAPAAVSTPTKAGQLRELISDLWAELGQPCSRQVVDRALSYADELEQTFRPERLVLCHGDPHPDNALAVLQPRQGADAGYVFVDPDGLPAPPAYDLGVVLRGWTAEVLSSVTPAKLLRGYAERLASATGVDVEEIWQWGFTERVSSGLYLLRHGHLDEGRDYLASAEHLM